MKETGRCYKCGKRAHWVCDAIIPGERGERGFPVCDREICEDHSVPEFKDGDRNDWTLCDEHRDQQIVK